jgi:KDO2-lipid IV(A) lauroyltransferase
MKDRLTDAAYMLGWAFVKLLPERVARGLFRMIADFVWRGRGKGVKRLESNLRRVVGPDVPDERLSELSRAGMRSYMRYWMEAFRLPVWSPQHIEDRVRPQDIDALFKNVESGRGVVLALSHSANWDLAAAWIALHGLNFTTVAERLEPESLFDRFVAYRESLGVEVLALTGENRDVFGTLVERLNAGRPVALLADRDLSASGIEVDFFGDKARMPAGPALLAIRTGAALIPVNMWYEEGVMCGRLEPEIPVPQEGTVAEKAAVMTQAMADAFATTIASHPEDWHMLQRLWSSDLDRDRVVPS